jgi:hypothetical protein
MIRANYTDKERVVDILTRSFDDNKSVNYIVKQDAKRIDRIRNLMRYSFEMCYRFGEVFLSDDRTGCALVVLPHKKKATIKSILLDLQLIFSSIGFGNINKALSRGNKIKELQPHKPMYYLWFIGVEPGKQHNGTGSTLLKEVTQQAALLNLPVYLETSTVKNLPWYKKYGFEVYNELDLGYRLYFLKRDEQMSEH